MEGRNRTIYIGNLPWRTNEDELADLFRPYGHLANVRIIQDKETGRSRGYGFVEFKETEPVQKAVDDMDGYELLGRSLTVSPARAKPPRERFPVVIQDR